MRLISLSHGDNLLDLNFDEIRFKKLNLFVGESASGKSITLNAIFEIGVKVVQDVGKISGHFRICFQHAGTTYEWELEAQSRPESAPDITKESLTKFSPDGAPTKLVDRTEQEFKFKGEKLPKMARQSTSIYLLREEEDIKPVYAGFRNIMRRDFATGGLGQAFAVQAIPKELTQRIQKEMSLETLFPMDLTVSARLFILKEYFREKYKLVFDTYKEVFSFIEQFEFRDMRESGEGVILPGNMPYLHVKERKTINLIPTQRLSSGMKKVLLILTDVVMLPGGMVYLIDEYENSLGLNAINFLPTLITNYGGDNQFIVTSHHPYLINAVPVANWIVFHRDGLNISVKHGDELAESYGKSKQQAFIKLINDPFFTEGAAAGAKMPELSRFEIAEGF